ncbi:squalene/oxidosqualene cyclase [Rippkaea orientalis PCC 8801]|uniref:Squalene/oxidosqualene cyclase n=1 Tax=Rippkaea orientalis (strain PCC 8801 / RF-1) TaxID=41431 RepID=B7JUY9_RIPO1|nr:squalene--hopene cyclase [Rippkaea orientalis]ACK66841.1 squalene/oxidosqualene cyclase [Rippkaea orientalis PCC 8801]
MQTQNRVTSTQKVELSNLTKAIIASQNYIMSRQYPEGYWWGELESNITLTAETILLHKIWKTDKTRPFHKVETYLRRQQNEQGGWELFYGDGGELSTSVEAYMALRLLGVTPEDPALIRAKDFILSQGGISKTRIFTKFHLALIGCYDWKGIPSIPPWIMLFPDNFPFTIYEMSSWARESTVPLLIVFDKKPIFEIEPAFNLDELYAEGVENVKYALPRNHNWSDIFLGLDKLFKWTEKNNLVPFHKKSLQAAERWMLNHQQESGDWGGIMPPMVNSLIAFKVLNYDVADPSVQRGFEAIDRFSIEEEDTYRVQACVSPVWDTAWVIRALVDSGLKPDHPSLVKAGEWLLDKQILEYGDWAIKNKQGKPGGWAFEFINRFYPDLDDSAVVVMALNGIKLPDENCKKAAINRCLEWMATMQCKPGGWAAFDVDNDQAWINEIPYGDLKAMIDPNTADVTARVLEMVGSCGLKMDENRVQKALFYLEKEQESDGSWFGRWGVNYIYGTSGVLSALAVIAPNTHKPQMEKAVNWLISCQNEDGGWGETCWSYNDPSLKGTGVSTASQTAWALIGLLDAGEALETLATDAIKRGINYLLDTQTPDGTWEEAEFTGTGFPCHFYIRYHLYRHYFPLIALGRYWKIGLKNLKG